MPTWSAIVFLVIGAWGAIVAAFPEWARNLWIVKAFNRDNWWIQKASRVRLLGITLALMGFTFAILGLSGVLPGAA